MQSFAGALPSFLSQIEDDKISVIFLKELWPEVVGSDLARRTKPKSLSSGTLLLETPDPVWKGQLIDLSSMIIRSINRYWGRQLVTQIEMSVES